MNSKQPNPEIAPVPIHASQTMERKHEDTPILLVETPELPGSLKQGNMRVRAVGLMMCVWQGRAVDDGGVWVTQIGVGVALSFE